MNKIEKHQRNFRLNDRSFIIYEKNNRKKFKNKCNIAYFWCAILYAYIYLDNETKKKQTRYVK